MVRSTLSVLDVNNNLMTSVSASMLSSLSKLKMLDLGSNDINAFPNLSASGQSLTDLVMVDAGIPDLVPADTDHFQNLEMLKISGGRQTRFPNLTAMSNAMCRWL